jgi:hypothetical protein
MAEAQHPANQMPAVGERWWRHEGGGSLCVATEKNAKIVKVHSFTSCVGHDDFVKTKLFIKVNEKNKGKALYYN